MPVGAAADSSSLAAEFVLFSPNGKFSPEPNQTVACKPSGYHMAPPSSFYKSYKSYKSYASATPPRHAHRRCHQVALHTPTVNLPVALPPAAHQRPSQTTPRPANPRGIQWRTHIPLKNSQRFPKIPKDSHTTPRPRRPQTPAAIKQAQKKRLGLCQTAVFKRAISLPPVEPATPSVPSAEFLPCREKVSFRRLRLKRRRSNQKAHSPVQRCSFHSRAA